MSEMFAVKLALKALFLPPGGFLLLLLLAWLLHKRARVISRTLLGLGLIGLYLFSTPYFVDRLLLRQVEFIDPLEAPWERAKRGQAIVVLGGGQLPQSIDYARTDQPNSTSFERLRYAAMLQRATKLPVLTTGGVLVERSPGLPEPSSEAQVMANTLISDYQVVPRWVEGNSENTAENAEFSADILKRDGIRRIVLVTHAYHMPRALRVFEQQGLTVIPAPMGYLSSRFRVHQSAHPWRDFLPSGTLLDDAYLASHELVGQLWYQFQH